MSPLPLKTATPAKCIDQINKIRFATWNVQTLNDSSSSPVRAELLIQRLQEYSIEICCLPEVRWCGTGTRLVDGWTIAFSGRDDGLSRQGVGIALSPLAARSLLSVEAISEGVIVAHLQLRGRKLTVICAYAPTNDYPDSEKDQFFTEVQEALDRASGRDLMLMGGL